MVALAQLVGRGFSESQVHKRVATGRLHRVHQGVYSIAPPELLTLRGHYMAAVLACGESAVLSHRSAGHLRELCTAGRGRIDVIVSGESTRRHRGIQVHRSRNLTPADITAIDGIPCTTVARTLLDLAAVISSRPLERALDQAEIQGVLDLRALAEQIERNRQTTGAKRLRAAMAGHDETVAPTESELEDGFTPFCAGATCPSPSARSTSIPVTASPP